MVKAILFDFGQTLVNSASGFREAEKIAKMRLFQDLQDQKSVKSWDTFLPVYRQLRKEFHQQSNFSRPALWQAVYRQFAGTGESRLLTQWEGDYWDTVKTHTQPFPEVNAVLDQLRQTYRLGLITNTQGQKTTGTHRIALFPQLETFFEIVIVAGEGGVPPKPDPSPFQQALSLLGIEPAQSIYVGDDWRIDVCGSKAVGMQPVWLKHHLVARNWPAGDPHVAVITALDQLPDLVASQFSSGAAP